MIQPYKIWYVRKCEHAQPINAIVIPSIFLCSSQDGSSALKISLEAGYRDIGVLLYAHEYMTKNKSPYTSLRSSGRRKQSTSSLSSSTTALAAGSGATAAVTGSSSATTNIHHSSLGIAANQNEPNASKPPHAKNFVEN